MSEPPASCPEKLLHRLAIGARDGHEDADTVDREHAEAEEQPAAELGDLDDVVERGQSHSRSPS
jgi:hypothetical protein